MTAHVPKEKPTCTTQEREFLDRLYEEHPELKDDVGLDFDGWYCDWQEIIDICARAGCDSYSESPTELIHQIINQRDELVAKAAATPGVVEALRAAYAWMKDVSGHKPERFLNVELDSLERIGAVVEDALTRAASEEVTQ